MRNIIKQITIAGAMALVLTTGTGCLKDKLSDDQLTDPNISGSPKMIEIPGTVKDSKFFNSASIVSVPNSKNDTTFDVVYVRLAADQPASEDIQVQLELDDKLLDAYNDSSGTSLEQPPASVYSFDNTSLLVTIPKGSRQGSLKMKVVPEKIADGPYAFGFRIKSVSNSGYRISGNFGNTVAVVGVRNKYDGVYEVSGSLVDLVNGSLSSVPGNPYPFEVELVTTGATSVAMYATDIPEYGHLIAGPSYYGSFSPVFTFDESTNKIISVTNYWGQLSGPSKRSAEIDPTGANKYNPADKTIDAKYFMTQNGSVRTKFDDHFKYIGPRP